MIWPRQVTHVAAKDLRGSRWPLTVYALGVAYCTLTAVGWPTLGPTWRGEPTMLLTAFAMIVTAQLVLADSPARFDAFFATQPLAPSAVAMGKVLAVFVGVVTPAVVGGLIVLRVFRIPWADLHDPLLSSVVTQALAAGLAMAIAVLVRNLATFLITLVAGFAGTIATASLVFHDDTNSITLTTPGWAPLIAPLIVFGVVIGYQYATRNTRRSRQLAAAGLGVLILVVAATSTTHAAADDRGPGGNAAPKVGLSLAPHSSAGRVSLVVPSLAPGERVALEDPRLTLEVDGRREVIALDSANLMSHPALRVAAGLRLVSSTTPTDTVVIPFSLTDAQQTMAAEPGARFRIEAMIEIDSQHVVGAVPVRAGAIGRMEGVLVAIDGPYLRPAPIIQLTRRSLDMTGAIHFDALNRDYAYEVVNAARREVVIAEETGYFEQAPAFATIPGSMGSEWAVSGVIQLRAARGVDDAWLAGARLSMIKWEEARRFRVSALAR